MLTGMNYEKNSCFTEDYQYESADLVNLPGVTGSIVDMYEKGAYKKTAFTQVGKKNNPQPNKNAN